MDFFQICIREVKGGVLEAYPDFIVGRSKDLMVRGRGFYAIWDEEANLWSTDEYDVQRLVDAELAAYAKKHPEVGSVMYTRSFTTNAWNQFRKFMSQIGDNSRQLDEVLTFANTEVKKSDYVSRRLPYSLTAGDHSAWDELVGTLYAPEERAKIEWAIGAVVSGDSKKIQKFLVLYGDPGTGKGTVLDIILKLFEGYTTTFEAKTLVAANNGFALEIFKSNPLVAVQHDGDLSRIEDNSKLNSITSHEAMTMNEKYKSSYTFRVLAFLFLGTNKPVKITDAQSGIIRRLIDVHPSGNVFPAKHYQALMSRIDFELGAIAQHCLETYREMGKNYYNAYRPIEMMFQTDIFFNFIEYNRDIFKEQDGTTLRQAYTLYKEFCNDTGIDKPLPQYKFRSELRHYFRDFKDRDIVDGVVRSSYYSGFTAISFKTPLKQEGTTFSLVMDETESLLDSLLAERPAQYAKADGTPKTKWDNVKTILSDLDTTKLHYVKVHENHIVIDFDLKDDDGGKSLERNLEAASEWPPTYAEFSKSGSGIHLHYVYEGDVSELSRTFSDGIEIKVFSGDSSLRRRLSKCNGVSVATISSGLPLKEKKVLHTSVVQSERGLRELLDRNFKKQIHPGTKPSIDFMSKILDDAYQSGMQYDVTDLKAKMIAFANNSTNQPLQCLKTVQRMKFKSEEIEPLVEPTKDSRAAFFDLEVYPNLFVVCWKFKGDPNVVRMINPNAQDVESLFQLNLVGYNNRRYDNHILWARYMGYNNEQLYQLSQKIIVDKNVNAMFGAAYNISYTDIYDFLSERKSLKLWQIELGLKHQEMDIPWDQPVKNEDIPRVVEYCVNDVISTEIVFEHRIQDFTAREILADLSGLTVNDTTTKHAAKIIFREDKNPQQSFIYTDLSKEFPGYVFDKGISTYRGDVVGEGGYVYAEPGVYKNVALLDVASMHPTSIERLNAFGEYTERFSELTQARLAIKRKDHKLARTLLGGRLEKFITDNPSDLAGLSDALKIIINRIYGLTTAKFDNPFRDVRNVDNIVAKRGALFMIDLKHFVQERGYVVAHIKTDSIKIVDADPEIIRDVMLFGEKYGYTFEHEATYDKFALVNDAVYIAHVGWNAKGKDPYWYAVGAQFQHPYVYKALFTRTQFSIDDLCETKQVTQGAMYLDFEHDKPMVLAEGMHFVGRTGRFMPVREGFGGAMLYRVKDDKPYAVTGTKGYLWVEAEVGKTLPAEAINMEYFERLAEDARKTIENFGSFTEFVS